MSSLQTVLAAAMLIFALAYCCIVYCCCCRYTYRNKERFSTPSSRQEEETIYKELSRRLLPPACVDREFCSSLMEDVRAINDPQSNSSSFAKQWQLAIRPVEISASSYLAPDSSSVLGSRPWIAHPVSSDANKYPDIVAALRAIVSEAFNDNNSGSNNERPHLIRATIEGRWSSPCSGAEEEEDAPCPGGRRDIWRALACFSLPDQSGQTVTGRCLSVHMLGEENRGGSSRAFRPLFIKVAGDLPGDVLFMVGSSNRADASHA